MSDDNLYASLKVQLDEEFDAEVGKVVMSSTEAQELIRKAIRATMNKESVAELVRDAAETAILSCVRGYFSHGKGRQLIDEAVMKSVELSPLMQAVNQAIKE